jgi:hypothetical protein
VPPVWLLEVDVVDKAGAEGAHGDAVVDDSEEGRSLPFLSIVDAFEALASSTAFFSALAQARRVA